MILIPETNAPVVHEYMDTNPEGVQFEPLTLEESIELLKSGEVNAVIAGAETTSADVVRAGIRNLDMPQGLVSSFMMMTRRDGTRPLFLADCAVNPDPTPEQLAIIAEQTVRNVKNLGFTAVVAFLSFSTEGSAGHTPQAKKVKEAFDIFRTRNPLVEAYGEVQFDAAYVPSVYQKKTGDRMGNEPNVFIFPDLNSGNIAYKIMERIGHMQALGPFLQGFNHQYHDLSRGVDAPTLARIVEVIKKLVEAEDGQKKATR